MSPFMVFGAIFVGIVSLAVAVLVARRLGDLISRVCYYLPPTSVGELSKELKSLLGMQTAYVEALKQKYEEMATATEALNKLLVLSEMLRDGMAMSLNHKVESWVAQHGNEFFDDVIRNVSNRMATHIEMGLVDRTTKLAGEYVLLHSLDSLDVNISLEAKYTAPERIREALIRLLQWEPAKARPIRNERDLVQQLKEQTASRQELDLLLGSLGSDLQKLQWQGAVALATKRIAPMETPRAALA